MTKTITEKLILITLIATPFLANANEVKNLKTRPAPEKVYSANHCYYADKVYSVGSIRKAETGEKIKCELTPTTSDVFGQKAPQWIEVVKSTYSGIYN